MKNANIKYANKVVSLIPVNNAYKKRIKDDILSRLSEYEGGKSPEELMGEPKAVAMDFIENIDPSDLETPNNRSYSYRSDTEIFGIPLLDIQLGNRQIAKGVIAIGDFAVGILSIGGINAGILSLGGISIGLISLAGIAFGIIGAVGGIAISYLLSIGGLAVAHTLAIGGAAYAVEIAIGDVTQANLSVYISSFKGNTGFDRSLIPYSTFENQLDIDYPNLSQFLKNIIKLAYGSKIQ